MKISLIESYQVQDVRHYELDETKIEADFGSTENFEEALFLLNGVRTRIF